MTCHWITRKDGVLVQVWVPEYTEDATYAEPDHPYGTAGLGCGHEGHWTDPNIKDAA